MSAPFLYLAPIRGITDASFRSIFHRHFPFFDAAIAPFTNPQRYASLKEKFLVDLLPENNRDLPVVPQLIYNNADDFLHLATRLQDIGYTHINWNLGCPAPTVANKKRGSGLLPYRDTILRLLDQIIPALHAQISIKARLGFQENDDLEKLLPDLAAYPLKEIIIHPRTGKQLYKGSVNLAGFASCTDKTTHTLVYNGDICTSDDFQNISKQFPQISRFMIGRGALSFPFLPGEIKKSAQLPQSPLPVLRAFHDELYQSMQEHLSGPSHILSHMKQVWNYFIDSFVDSSSSVNSNNTRKKIQKCSSLPIYHSLVEQLFAQRGEQERTTES